MTASALYEGTVQHRRFAAVRRTFEYGLHMAYIDLDELPNLLGGSLVRRRPGLVRFRRSDYFGPAEAALADSVRAEVERRTGVLPVGPVRLLTNLRALGHCFNPVSFYYCFDAAGERVEALLADVTNTPWNERHAYVLRAAGDGDVIGGRSAKRLHVSPFMGMDHEYTWRAVRPGRRLGVHIECRREGELAFDATLNLARRELSRRSLAELTARRPAGTLQALARIYGQALRLRLRGAPVYPHPAR